MLDKLLTERADQLRAIDDAIIGEVVGVAQAMDHIRKAVDEIDQALEDRRFDRAAALGYGDIASAFIFLQRALAGLQAADQDREVLTSDLAARLHCAYEDIEAQVTAKLDAFKPRPALSDEERAAAHAAMKQKLASLRNADTA